MMHICFSTAAELESTIHQRQDVTFYAISVYSYLPFPLLEVSPRAHGLLESSFPYLFSLLFLHLGQLL